MYWCHRCDRWFGSDRALDQHTRNSSLHHTCRLCDEEYEDQPELIQHYQVDHWFCTACIEVRSVLADSTRRILTQLLPNRPFRTRTALAITLERNMTTAPNVNDSSRTRTISRCTSTRNVTRSPTSLALAVPSAAGNSSPYPTRSFTSKTDTVHLV
jgi:hypothetical protein